MREDNIVRSETSKERKPLDIEVLLRESTGLEFKDFSEDFKARLRLLSEKTDLFVEAREASVLAKDFFTYEDAEEFKDPNIQRGVLQALFLSDVGKAGPLGASEVQQKAVLAVFNINDQKPKEVSLEQAVTATTDIPETEKQKLKETLVTIKGVNLDMNLREFFKLHFGWSNSILSDSRVVGSRVTPEAKNIAANHHRLQGDYGEYKDIGYTLNAFGKPDLLVIVLDQIMASRYRQDSIGKQSNIDKTYHEIFMQNVFPNLYNKLDREEHLKPFLEKIAKFLETKIP